jgi:hypothetical protein
LLGVTQLPATTAPQPQLLLQVCVSVARPRPQAAHTRVLFFFWPGVHAAVTPPHAPQADQADHLLEVRGELATYFATSHPDAPPGSDRFWFRDRILAYGSAGLKTLEGQGVANDGFGHLRYTRMHWLHFGSEVFVQAQYDKFRLLRRRLLAGVGVRVVFINYDWLRGWIGTGALIEFERRNIPPENQPPLGPDPVNMTNPRSSSYITLIVPLVPERLNLIATAYVQPRWDIWRDVQVLHEAKLQVKVTGHHSINTDLSVRFDSRPPVLVERTDTRIGNSVQYSY